MPKNKKPKIPKSNPKEEKKDKGNLPKGFIRFRPSKDSLLNSQGKNIPRPFASLFFTIFEKTKVKQINTLIKQMGISNNFDFNELMAKAKKHPELFKKVLELRNPKRIAELDKASGKTGELLIAKIFSYAKKYKLDFNELVLLDLPSFEKKFTSFKKLYPKIFENLRLLKIKFDYLVLFKKALSKETIKKSDFLNYLMLRVAESPVGLKAGITINELDRTINIFSPENVEARIQILLNKHKKNALQHINKFLVNFLEKKFRFNAETADILAAYLNHGNIDSFKSYLDKRLNLLEEKNVPLEKLEEIRESAEKFIEFFSKSKKPN